MERGLERERTTEEKRCDEEEEEGGMSAKLLLQLYHGATWRIPVLCCQVLSRKTRRRQVRELDSGQVSNFVLSSGKHLKK